MRLLITDSGVGGLSVCAFAERFLRTRGIAHEVTLTYVNAAPENDFGYNSMASREEKLASFDRFLGIVADTWAPDMIFVACNTLSVLMADTPFVRGGQVPVRGIVDIGVERLLRDLGPDPLSTVTIFGTVTTIDEQTYPDRLRRGGIDRPRIVAQACPSLADTISEDRQGTAAQAKIRTYVGEAVDRSPVPLSDHLTYLACTHYGYRKELFEAAFTERGIDTEILNPNEFVAEDLLSPMVDEGADPAREGLIEVEFVTRYRIPETALETISFFLDSVSPKTVRAFTGYNHMPDLF